MVLVLLTLEKHQDGIWVTRLVQALRAKLDVKALEIRIIPIEHFFDSALPVESIFQNVTGIINRVSDAADPVAFKTTVTLLTAARHLGIPVFCANCV